MRIAVSSVSNQRVGGTETYLASVLRALSGRGHEVLFAHEHRSALDADLILSPDEGIPLVDLSQPGGLAALRDWRPEVIYHHGFHSPELDEALLSIAPTVYFLHVFVGTCISGSKTLTIPTIQPCSARFGPACLVKYFPRGCGGRNPFTMWQQYRQQAARLALLVRYSAVLSHTEYMREEFARHGIAVRIIRFLIDQPREALAPRTPRSPASPGRVLFLGRMERNKGGDVLLRALGEVKARSAIPVSAVFAGDGSQRAPWQALTKTLGLSSDVEFVGWVDRARRNQLLAETDLLAVSSLWPEPFGMVGPEAGAMGTPVVAFDVGGVSQWLSHDVNGLLVRPSTPTAMAAAILECLADPARLARYSAGGIELARRFSLENHLTDLLEVFEGVVKR